MFISASLIAFWLVCGHSIALASFYIPQRSPQPTVAIAVDTSIKFQELDGFGCTEVFQRAEDVLGKEGLSIENQNYVLDLLFSEDLGAGFTILRNGIGSSNSSASNFMISIEPVSPGSPNAPPHYKFDHIDSGQFPLAQQAYVRGLQKLYGNAWSAPGFMKTNDDENNGGFLCGVSDTSCSTGNWMQAYANYLVQWVRFYEESGVRVTHLGFLNEPQFTATYAGMLSNGTQAAEFVRVLFKTIEASGMDLKITCCDSITVLAWSCDPRTVIDSIGWEDQEAMLPGLKAGPDPAINYISVITGHGYDSNPNFTLSTPTKSWVTEWADFTGDFTPFTFFQDGGPGEGMTWASNIQVALVDANVSAFVFWVGAENATSNSCLINLVGNEVIISKRYWAFSHFSKFARPGAYRVKATSSNSLLTVSSFLNLGGSVATQVINSATVDYTVELQVTGSSSNSLVQSYLTNNANNLTELQKICANNDGKFTTSIPAQSLMSFVVSL